MATSRSLETPRPHDLTRLVVKGAREHNLRNVDLDLPRDAMIVFTGLSGSGKSSLAFDTIFAEGQRRYVESLSAYARQFLGQVDKPDVDFIEGLSPAVSIDQKSTSKNPRSTVGTITEIYDYMRLLWARVGRPYCPVCGEAVTKQTPQQIVDQLLELEPKTRFQVLAPVVRGRKGEFVDLFKELGSKGYSRARVDGETIQLSDPPKLGKQFKHTIEVVVDRLAINDTVRQRLTDSIETALNLAEGRVLVDFVDLDPEDEGRVRAFSENLACPNEHPLAIDEIEPRSFSFNNPFGACPACSGIGTRLEVDEDLIIPDVEHAAGPRRHCALVARNRNQRILEPPARGPGRGTGLLRWKPPGTSFPPWPAQAILHGKDHKVVVQYKNRFGRERKYSTGFEGVVQYIHRKHLETESDNARDKYEEYMRQIPCPECNGARLNPASLSVLINGKSIAEVSRDADARMLRLPRKPGPDRTRGADRQPGPQGDPGPPALPAGRRTRIPEPGTRRRNALRRRGPAHPPGHADRLRPGRACSTSSTNPPSACTSATTAGSSRR